MAPGGVRPAGKAGTPTNEGWYVGAAGVLAGQLDGFLADVPNPLDGKELPIAGARVVIAP